MFIKETEVKILLTQLNKAGISRDRIRTLYRYLSEAGPEDLACIDPGSVNDFWPAGITDVVLFFSLPPANELFKFYWAIHCTECNSVLHRFDSLENMPRETECGFCNAHIPIHADINISAAFGLQPGYFSSDSPISMSPAKYQGNGKSYTAFRFITNPDWRAHSPALISKLPCANTAILCLLIDGLANFYREYGEDKSDTIIRGLLSRYLPAGTGIMLSLTGNHVCMLFSDAADTLKVSRAIFDSFFNDLTDNTQTGSNGYAVRIGLNGGPVWISAPQGALVAEGLSIVLANSLCIGAESSALAVSEPLMQNKAFRNALYDLDISYSLREKSIRGYDGEFAVYSAIM